jgi:hypothetical protein
MAFSPILRPNFQRGALIEGVPVVLRADLNALRRDMDAALQQSVMARIFGMTLSPDNTVPVNNASGKPMAQRIAFRVVEMPITLTEATALFTPDGLALLPTDDDFKFTDGTPVIANGKMLFMGFVSGTIWRSRWIEVLLDGGVWKRVAYEAEIVFGSSTPKGTVGVVNMRLRTWGGLSFFTKDNWKYPATYSALTPPTPINWINKDSTFPEPYPGWESSWTDRNPDGNWQAQPTGKASFSDTASRDPLAFMAALNPSYGLPTDPRPQSNALSNAFGAFMLQTDAPDYQAFPPPSLIVAFLAVQ